jgi:hypothetical protein
VVQFELRQQTAGSTIGQNRQSLHNYPNELFERRTNFLARRNFSNVAGMSSGWFPTGFIADNDSNDTGTVLYVLAWSIRSPGGDSI